MKAASVIFARADQQMPQLTTAEPVGSTTFKAIPTQNHNNGKQMLRHVLEFEKPLSKLELQIQELEALQDAKRVDYSKELRQLRSNYTSLLKKTYENLTPWETVQVARHPQRPLFKDYVEIICREFR